MKRLGLAMEALRVSDLSAESFHEITLWLLRQTHASGVRRWSEHQVSITLGDTIRLYDYGIGRQLGWTRADLDVMELRKLHALRGKGRRMTQAAVEKSITDNEFVWLFRALQHDLASLRVAFIAAQARSEMEWLSDGNQPNPFVALALILVLCHGVRSSELNAMEVGHFLPDAGRLYLVPPDKPPTEILLARATLELFDMCVAWGAIARRHLGTDLLFCHTTYKLPTRRATREGMPTRHTCFSTKLLNEYYTRCFFARHFETRVRRQGVEQPLLYREPVKEGEAIRPLYCSLKKLRNAFVRAHMDAVDDPAETQRAARHKNPQTTQAFYGHRDKLGSARRVGSGLRRVAAVVGLGLQSRVTAGTPEERAILSAKGRLTPTGGCNEPSAARPKRDRENRSVPVGCRVHPDCVTCDYAELHASMRPVIVDDRDKLLDLADRLEEDGFQREAENRRTRAAYLQAQIDRIDHVTGGDE